MAWKLKPEPTMSSLEGSLIREIGAHNFLGTTTPELSTHPSPGTQTPQGHLRYTVMEIWVFYIFLKWLVTLVGCLHAPCVLSLWRCWELPCEYPTLLSLQIENVSESFQQDIGWVCIPHPCQKSPLWRSAKACQCFLLKHSFYGLGNKACRLAGEMTKCCEGARKRRGN